MEQLERIRRMEALLDEGTAAAAELERALERYSAARDGMEALFAYYLSPLWRQDLADDEAGRLPRGLKRGVLSQDGVDSLLTACRRLDREIGGGAPPSAE